MPSDPKISHSFADRLSMTSCISAPVSQLVSQAYVSKSKLPMSEAQILELLSVSRRNNQALNITGILLHRDGEFFQVLEGSASSVNSLLEKIALDPRHDGIMPFSRECLAERRFGEFSMGYPDTNTIYSKCAEFLPFFKRRFTDERFRAQPESVQQMLAWFKTHLK